MRFTAESLSAVAFFWPCVLDSSRVAAYLRYSIVWLVSTIMSGSLPESIAYEAYGWIDCYSKKNNLFCMIWLTFHCLSTEFSVCRPPCHHVSRINLSAHANAPCIFVLSTTCGSEPSSTSPACSSLSSSLSSSQKLVWKYVLRAADSELTWLELTSPVWRSRMLGTSSDGHFPSTDELPVSQLEIGREGWSCVDVEALSRQQGQFLI